MELDEKGLRRYHALMRAADNAQNPEFKQLWKEKLSELIKQNQEEVNLNVKSR